VGNFFFFLLLRAACWTELCDEMTSSDQGCRRLGVSRKEETHFMQGYTHQSVRQSASLSIRALKQCVSLLEIVK